MRKLITTLIGTGILLSTNSFASLTPDCAACGYTSGLSAPKYAGSFYIGVTGAYVQSATSNGVFDDINLNFGTKVTQFDFDPGNSRTLATFTDDVNSNRNNKNQWAWGVEAGYNFACSANSIDLSYFHFNSNRTRRFGDFDFDNDNNNDNDNDNGSSNGDFGDALTGFNSFLISDFGFLVGSEDDTSEATPIIATNVAFRTRTHFKFDQADIKFGRQYNDVCGLFQLKPSVGVRYARVDAHLNTSGVVDLSNDLTQDFNGAAFQTVTFDTRANSKFSGAGPLVSLDTRYGFCGGFGIVGRLDAALIVGKVDAHTTFASHIDSFFSDDDAPGELAFSESEVDHFRANSKHRAITNLGGRIGLDYNYCYCNKSSLTFEVGYQANSFFNAVDVVRGNVRISDLIEVNDSADDDTGNERIQHISGHESGSFTYHGPYAEVTWHI